ncbi:MAG: transporter related protein [Parcubacteria group bacterium]|nr:transporter related protein [Parcubacteria group bacterium]
MKKLRENLITLWLATRYSLAFCLRNSKKDTLAKMGISVSTTFVAFFGMQAIGLLVNALQKAHGNVEVLIVPLACFAAVQILNLLTQRAQVFYQGKWRQELKFANHRELNEHRATLDVACFRSKKYDDVSKHIRELPNSWGTRIEFAEQALAIFSLIVSFTLFGASLVRHKPIYALILFVLAMPKMVSEFGLVSMWWSMMERHVPHHKKRDMLERPYQNVTAFVQAKMFNQMGPLGKDIAEKVKEVIDEYTGARRVVSQKKILTSLLLFLGLLGVVTHAAWMTVTTAGAIGTFTIILTSAQTFQGNLNSIMMMSAEQWNNGKGVILIERDFMGLKPDLTTEDPIMPDFTTPHVRFDRVSFAYPSKPEKEVLHEVSFEIEAGTKVAIVGKSGNGKSTLQALLMRHYDPTFGAIYADDINLQNIDPPVWNKYASSLTQDYYVQERTVGEEIASSRLGESIDLARVQVSAEFANFHDVVMEHEDGYAAQIGSDFDGREFSGGEKQRLALARVHYRGTPILILDEPDARLDPESADKVMDRVYAMTGVTVIIITHHVSRAERCDKVIVMGKGTVAEQGHPQVLVAQGGIYARMSASDKKRLGTSEPEAMCVAE